VSGDIFKFGSEYEFSAVQEGDELMLNHIDSEEQTTSLRTGGTCIQSLGNPTDAFVSRDSFNQLVTLLFLQSKSSQPEKYSCEFEMLAISVLKFLGKFYPICLHYSLEKSLSIQTLMKLSYLLKSESKVLSIDLLREVF
jgi:hypothetical protein